MLEVSEKEVLQWKKQSDIQLKNVKIEDGCCSESEAMSQNENDEDIDDPKEEYIEETILSVL